MQRKQSFPVANCSIKMPDSMPVVDGALDEEEPAQRRQQLVNFGHSQWGFNNWSWSVTKQDLDFVEMTNGKYTAGVVAFVSITVKTLDIHRENIGYATSLAPNKGSAIHRARKIVKTETSVEEEARAERKRRQRQAQEEFRLKHLMKQKATGNSEIEGDSCIDKILLAIPSQVITTEETGNTDGKRKSLTTDDGNIKRRNTEQESK